MLEKQNLAKTTKIYIKTDEPRLQAPPPKKQLFIIIVLHICEDVNSEIIKKHYF